MSNFGPLRMKTTNLTSHANVKFADAVCEKDEVYPPATPELIQQNYQRGYDEAVSLMQAEINMMQEKLQQAEENYRQQVQQLQQSFVDAVEGSRSSLLQSSVTLALQAADRILSDELSLRPDITKVLQEGLAEVIDRRDAELSVNPDEMELLQTLPSIRGLEIHADSGLRPGEFVLRHRHGEIDATVGGRLKVIADLLQQQLTEDESADD